LQLTFAVLSRNATRVEAWFYTQLKDADEIMRLPLVRGADDGARQRSRALNIPEDSDLPVVARG
jgi:hypothetical protein